MATITRNDLKSLSQANQYPCVSVYLPTHRVTNHVEGDRIVLKNLLTQVEQQLLENGMRRPDATTLLEPATRLHSDLQFWQHVSDGLAIFLGQGITQIRQFPISFPEFAAVSDRFHLKPLLPLLMDDGRYFVLSISQDEVRLYEGTRHSIHALELSSLPESLDDALKYDDPEKQLQFHTGATVRNGRRAAMFHGHGGVAGEEAKNRLLRYFRVIDAGLRKILREETAPLVLATVEYYLPIYRQANTYPHLVDQVIPGNPAGLAEDVLQKQAWEIVQPGFHQDRENAAALYHQAAGTGRASKTLEEVIPAAHHGRVASLFVARGKSHWGTFDPTSMAIKMHNVAKNGDYDLLDQAAVDTYMNGGDVYLVEPAELPDGDTVAAVYRY